MAGSSQPRLTALDRPALGLVMQIAALITLPTQLSMATVMLAEDLTGSGMRALVILQLIAAALQLAAGIAIARRSFARPLIIAYGIATLAVAAAAAAAFAAEEARSALAGAALEVLAGPLVILVAPLVLDLDRLDRLADRRSPADAAAALCVLAVGSLIAMPVGLIDEVRVVAGGHGSPTAWLWLLLRWVHSIAIAIVALRAVRALLRPGPPAAARRALAVYLVVSIGIGVAFGAMSILGVLMHGLGDHAAIVLAASLAVSLARPLVIWAYARPTLREPIAVERRAVASPLVWSVLWTVPLLLSRSPALGAMRDSLGSVLTAVLGALFCVQAIANVAAARAALRDDGRGFRPAAVATAVAVALLGIVLVWLYALIDLESPGAFRIAVDKPVWPLTVLIAMLGTLAWSQRRRSP